MSPKILFLILFFFIFVHQKAVTQEKKTFYDDFIDNKNSWNLTKNENFSSHIENSNFIRKKDRLVLKNGNKNNKMNALWKEIPINQNYDYSIYSKIMKTAGTDENEYGIIWRGADWDNFACLLISSAYFKVFEVENGKEKILKDWTYLEYINTYFFYNEFIIEKKYNKLNISINDTTIYSANYEQYIGNNIAFVTSGNLKIKIDLLEIEYFKKDIILQDEWIFLKEIEQIFKLDSLSPVISPKLSESGEEIYFSAISKNKGDSVKSYNIYSSQKNKMGFWQNTKILPIPANSMNDNFPVYIFPNDSLLITQNEYIEQKTQNLFICDKKNNTSNILEIKSYYNLYNFAGFCFSEDRKILISSIEQKDSYGSKDLYVSFLNDKGIYSKPLNMGKTLNTLDDEGTPFLSADGKSLFFYSFGHQGFGSSDIFISHRIDNTWTNWTKPQNLGKTVNSKFAEAFFITDKETKTAYFVSNKSGTEKIYKTKIIQK